MLPRPPAVKKGSPASRERCGQPTLRSYVSKESNPFLYVVWFQSLTAYGI